MRTKITKRLHVRTNILKRLHVLTNIMKRLHVLTNITKRIHVRTKSDPILHSNYTALTTVNEVKTAAGLSRTVCSNQNQIRSWLFELQLGKSRI